MEAVRLARVLDTGSDPADDAEMALAMHAAADAAAAVPGYSWRLRTGIASDPAVAGVIGHRKFSYDVCGDAVNLASRMESTGVPGMLQVAGSTWMLCGERYPFTPKDVEVKGLGRLRTYLLDPREVAATRSRRSLGVQPDGTVRIIERMSSRYAVTSAITESPAP